MEFIYSRNEDKLAVLLYLLKERIKSTEKAVIFVPTKHHVELIHAVFLVPPLHLLYSAEFLPMPSILCRLHVLALTPLYVCVCGWSGAT